MKMGLFFYTSGRKFRFEKSFEKKDLLFEEKFNTAKAKVFFVARETAANNVSPLLPQFPAVLSNHIVVREVGCCYFKVSTGKKIFCCPGRWAESLLLVHF